MANAMRDRTGRPIIVVTGMGVVSSLGTGKDDNWKNLTAGKSGIKQITRFPTEGLKTAIAGTVDELYAETGSAPVLSEKMAAIASEEAIAQAGIGSKGNFPGPLFCAVPPIEAEWPQRRAVAADADPLKPVAYEDVLKFAGNGKFRSFHETFMFATVAEGLAERFGTKGMPISLSTACASGATSIQLAVEAIRRGECDAALATATDGSVHAEALIRFSLISVRLGRFFSAGLWRVSRGVTRFLRISLFV